MHILQTYSMVLATASLTGLLYVHFVLVQASDFTSFSCLVSENTVQAVLSCPKNEKEFKEAALKKNCTAFSGQCRDPENLVYHCVIGPNHKGVFEVCAYWKIIHWGYCAEYSKSGNLIQQSEDTNCSLQKHNPCPMSYNSTEAYKYQSCYELARSSTVGNQLPKGTTTCSSVKNKSSKQRSGNNQVLAICIVFTTILRMFYL
ncbi:uncharacterized protein LOC134248684 isoform X2 [Saccostrea cucullata]|uniref:uncharacterized protein LOC134248684 isoform X2 n=1 Tax=Saccostrea cuccullata TaxID=36930 RepID=UPI002ED34E5C